MSRKIGIILALGLTLIFTFLIVHGANKKYERAIETVTVIQTTRNIVMGEKLNSSNTKEVEVIKKVAKGMASPQDIEGKSAKYSMVKGQYVYKDNLTAEKLLRPGYIEVFVPVDLSSSAYAMTGQVVNVHIVNDELGKAPLVLKNIRVLHCLNNQGKPIGSEDGIIDKAGAGKSEPASVGLEVPADQAEIVVHAASNKTIYLTRASG